MDFDALKNKASELLNEHGDKIDQGAEKAGEFVKGKFGHDEKVDQVVDKIQEATPERE
ncbi:MAG: antitoxin [Pseudonocardia sp.]